MRSARRVMAAEAAVLVLEEVTDKTLRQILVAVEVVVIIQPHLAVLVMVVKVL